MIRSSTKIKAGLYIAITCCIVVSVYMLGSLDIPQLNKGTIPKGLHRNLSQEASGIKKSVCEDRGIDLQKIDPKQLKKGIEYRTTIREGWRKENKLKKIIMGEKADIAGQIPDLIKICGPFALFSVLSFLGYWLYCMCQCCPDACCPPCKCCAGKNGKCCGCQCDRKNPYQGCCLYYPIVGMMLALGFIAVTALIGLGTTGGVEEGYDRMQCAIIKSMDAINYGDQAYKDTGIGFMGVKGFELKLIALAKEVDTTFKNSVKATFIDADTTWVTRTKSSMDEGLRKMGEIWPGTGDGDGTSIDITYTSATKKIVYNYAPNADNTGNTNDKISCYFSSVSENQFVYASQCGALAESPENVKKWEKNVKLTQAVIDESIKPTIQATQEVSKIGKDINSDIDTFSDSIKKGQEKIQKLETDFGKQMTDVNKQLNDVGKYIKDYVTPNLKIAYQAFIAISIFLVFISFLILIFKIYCLRHFLTVFWGLFAWLAFVILLLGTVLLVVNLAGAEICDFFFLALKDSKEFSKIDAFKGEPSKHLITCTKTLGGNGRIMDNFDMKKQMEQLGEMDEKLKQFDETEKKGKQGMQKLQDYVSSLSEELTSLIDTAKADGIYDIQTIEGAVRALEKNGRDNCSLDDKWLNDRSVACPTGYSDIYANHVYMTVGSAGSEQDMNIPGSKKCIWWNGKPEVVSAPSPGKLSDSPASDATKGFGKPAVSTQYGSRADTTAKSKQRYRTCNHSGTLQSMNRVMDWRDTKNKLCQYKYNQTKEFDEAFKDYKSSYETYIGEIKKFKIQTTDLTKSITDNKTGLIADDATNCLFVGESLHEFNNQMCSVFFVEFYTLTKTLHWFGFGLCFASLFMWQTSMRFAKNMKISYLNKINVEDSGDEEQGFNIQKYNQQKESSGKYIQNENCHKESSEENSQEENQQQEKDSDEEEEQQQQQQQKQ